MKSKGNTTFQLAGLALALGLPMTGAAQSYSQTEEIVYQDNVTKWVLGQVAQRKVNGIVASSTTFDGATALPLTQSSFGKLQQTLTYNADGTMATVKDGNNNVTTLSNWYRGIPRNIGYADGTGESAAVNDRGWITSVTDENGYVTGYGYDAMGRLANITYPTDDSTAWNSTTLAFERVAGTEYGIPAGHWRQTVTTGNGKKITYYDAMWRPVVVQEYDAANVAGTQRFQRFTYDHDGRVTFAAYPGTTDALSTGTWTDYDALGRVTSVSQDSEQGLLTTTTEYLSGFQTRVTTPRGQGQGAFQQTTTRYMAYDQPSTDWPVLITHPEGAYTEINRDAFGKPTTIRRRNGDSSLGVTRSYVYAWDQTLCKSIEPETGATVFYNDAAGNLWWSASGLNLPDAGNCNFGEAQNSGRVVSRSYDARNRLASLSFPDGRGNQTWTYTPDGLPASITTYNDPGNGAAVSNGYTYNKRRLLTAETSGQSGWYTWGMGYGYNANGQLSSQSYPTGLAVSYSPNALGQPTAVTSTDGWTYASGVSYYPNGAIKQFTYGNGIVHTMTQNARQLPSRSTDAGVIDYENSFDANGNATAILDRVRGDHYSRWMTYDGLDRLTSAGSCSFGGDCWHRFTYDALDNLKSWKLAGVKDYADYVYDAGNRLSNIRNGGGATIVGLTYDVQGNLSNRNGQGYVFDYGNRLRETSGKEWYRYDGHGRRVLNWRATESGVLSVYNQSGQLMYDENYRASGRKASEYVYLAGSLLTTRARNIDTNAWTVTFQHTDALGSPVAVTNTAGQVVDRTDYEPYGAAINKPNYDGIGYAGHVMDSATGLTYMQQRYYDPAAGVFLSVDPVTAYGSPVGQFHRYRYANGNPYKFTDPDGRAPAPSFCERMPGRCKQDVIPVIKDCRFCLGGGTKSKSNDEETPHSTGGGSSSDTQELDKVTVTAPKREDRPGYWQRVNDNFLDANKSIPGLLAPPFAGAVTGRALSNATTLPTIIDALAGSYRTGRLTLEIVPAAAHMAMNFVVVTASWEAGLYAGSMINAAPVPGGDGTTYREWYTDALCDATGNC